MWLQQAQQLAVSGIINGSFYALLGTGFALILGVTGRFHYAYALVFTLAAYVASVLAGAGAPMVLAAAAGVVAAIASGMAVERWIYRPLAASSGPLALLTILISSLGVTIVGVNLITLLWSSAGRSLDLMPIWPMSFGLVTFTTLDLAVVAVAWASIAALDVVLGVTGVGRSIRAVRGNPGLARILGIDPDRIYLVVFGIGSLLCGLAGILNGARFAVLPDMGNRPVVLAFVIAFLGGSQSRPLLVGCAGLAVGLIESLSGLWVAPQWSPLIVFSMLLLYLCLRPLDIAQLRARLRPS